MANVGNWTVEVCSTVGTGDLNLVGTDDGYARFRDSIPAGQVWYAIEDGNNREAGIGTFDGVSIITRDEVKVTLVNGVYNDSNPDPINLSGEASVGCTFNKSAYDELIAGVTDYYSHKGNTNNPHNVTVGQVGAEPDLGNPVVDGYVLSSDTAGNRSWIEMTGDMTKAVYDTNDNGVVDDAEKVNGLTVETAVPSGAVFTDTTDHTLLSNIGTNSHADIDSHIADGSVHYPQSSISITESQISDFGDYEPDLGLPGSDGQVLASDTAGARSWVNMPVGGGDLWVGDTPPADKNEYPIWLDSASGKKYTWYQDIDSGQWLQENAVMGATALEISWGNIIGTLSNQTDLQAELDAKENGLGNPSTDGYVLSSDTAGNRSWVEMSGGGGIGDMTKAVYDTNDNGIVDNAELVNGLTVETAVPVDAVFTDTIYDDTAVQAHMADTNNPHTVTASQTGAVPTAQEESVGTLVGNAIILTQAEYDGLTAKQPDTIYFIVG